MNQNNTKSEIDFKYLLTQIKKQGIAEINDFIDQKKLNELQNFIYNEINTKQKGYRGCVGAKNLESSPFKNIDSNYGITKIFERLLLQISKFKRNDNKLYQVLRVLSGENQGLKQAYKFHYDAYVLTALLPIIIPNRADGMNGDFLYLMNRRKLHQNFLRNVFQKLIIQNPITQYFLRKKYIQKLLDIKICKLKPGNLYLFLGFQTIHGNGLCSPNSPRATLLLHYSDPFNENLFFKNIENLNILRTNIRNLK